MAIKGCNDMEVENYESTFLGEIIGIAQADVKNTPLLENMTYRLRDVAIQHDLNDQMSPLHRSISVPTLVVTKSMINKKTMAHHDSIPLRPNSIAFDVPKFLMLSQGTEVAGTHDGHDMAVSLPHHNLMPSNPSSEAVNFTPKTLPSSLNVISQLACPTS